ncbi:MAG: RNB domain-containing ribonuclease [Acidobacteriota bacterium]
MAEQNSESSVFIGRVGAAGQVEDAFADEPQRFAVAASVPRGAWGRFRLDDGTATLQGAPLAPPGSALADLYALAARRRLTPLHPPAVMAETAAVVADPGIDDPALEDLTHLPFVTIDEVHSRDLDQALFIERQGDGFTVWYAIADPAWSIRPGTALFAEALRRGATYYLPGLVIPMLPKELSEDTVSLNPDVDRRAMVFEVILDADGRVEHTRIHRARVRSRVKTAYDLVQAYFDGTAPLAGADVAGVAESLQLLAEVGQRRMALAEARDVVSLRRSEIAVSLAGHEGLRFVAMADPRNDVERYNEQISLLCNVEGARFLKRGDRHDDGVQPIYRVHDAPAPARLDELADQIAALVELRGLDADLWSWRRGRGSLADYLRALPESGPEARLARSIHRQAMLVGGRSQFATVPGIHYGVGAEVYGRFTAPMREIVGIFEHKETWEKLGLERAPSAGDDEALREQIVAASNAARQTQRKLDREVNRRVLDQLFADDLRRDRDDRPRRRGTVMGVSRSKVHVSLDQPPVDVKVYIHHLKRQLGGRLGQGRDRMTLRRFEDGAEVHTVGDEVSLQVRDRDRQRDRWELEIHPTVED